MGSWQTAKIANCYLPVANFSQGSER